MATQSPVLLSALLASAVATPLAADDSASCEIAPCAQGAMARRLAVLAPKDTFLWIRVRGALPSLHELAARVARWTAADGPLAGMVADPDLLRARSAIKLLGNVERSGPGRAITALANGDFAFGVRAALFGARPFLLARVDSEREAKHVQRLARTLLKLEIARHGQFLAFSPDNGTLREIGQAVTASDVEPTRAGKRILAELPAAAVAGWFDLQDAGPGTRLRRVDKLQNGGAAFFAGGMASAIGKSPAVTFAADFAGDHVRVAGFVDGVESRLSPQAKKLLFLDRPPLEPLPRVPGTIARVHLSRSIGDFFLGREQLVDAHAVRAIDQGLSNIENLFRGYQLETDLLPKVEPGLRGIVRVWNEGDKTAAPFRFPQGLLHIDYDGESVARAVRTAAQIIVLASNEGRKRNGQLPYVGEQMRIGHHNVAIGEIARPKGDRPWPFAAGIRLMSTAGEDGFFFGTSPALLREVLERIDQHASEVAEGAGRVLDRVELSLTTAATGLTQNLDVLTTRLMLGEGLLPDAAERLLTQLGHVLAAAGEVVIQTALKDGDLIASFDWRPTPGFFDANFKRTGGDK